MFCILDGFMYSWNVITGSIEKLRFFPKKMTIYVHLYKVFVQHESVSNFQSVFDIKFSVGSQWKFFSCSMCWNWLLLSTRSCIWWRPKFCDEQSLSALTWWNVAEFFVLLSCSTLPICSRYTICLTWLKTKNREESNPVNSWPSCHKNDCWESRAHSWRNVREFRFLEPAIVSEVVAGKTLRVYLPVIFARHGASEKIGP